jgi:peptidylprolyl isomerase
MPDHRWFARRPLLLLAALSALALALTACGGSDDSTPTPTSTAPPSEASTTAEATPAPTNEAGERVAGVGDTVRVHYTGSLDDGTVFDTSRDGDDPLQFVVGGGRMIVGFDNAVRGMAVGETITVQIPPDEAYGEVDPALIVEVPIDQAPEGLAVGDQVSLSGLPAVVTAVTDEAITVDANGRLAGKTLTFEIELVSIG